MGKDFCIFVVADRRTMLEDMGRNPPHDLPPKLHYGATLAVVVPPLQLLSSKRGAAFLIHGWNTSGENKATLKTCGLGRPIVANRLAIIYLRTCPVSTRVLYIGLQAVVC
jgi:hypothetical protein